MKRSLGQSSSHQTDFNWKVQQRPTPAGRTRILQRDPNPCLPCNFHDQGKIRLWLKRHPTPLFSNKKPRSRVTEGKGTLALRFTVMDPKGQTPLTPRERLEWVRSELESMRAYTNQMKWDNLKTEMEDLKDDLTDELQAGLKDSANLMGNLGQRLSDLEQKVEALTTAFSKIAEASAEATTSTGKKGKR
jgi:hypothetical protein